MQTPTVGGFEAVHQPDGQVAFGPELGSFLPHFHHHLGEALALVQLRQEEQGGARSEDGEKLNTPHVNVNATLVPDLLLRHGPA